MCILNLLCSLARRSLKSEHPLSASYRRQLSSLLPPLGGKKKLNFYLFCELVLSSPLVSPSTLPRWLGRLGVDGTGRPPSMSPQHPTHRVFIVPYLGSPQGEFLYMSTHIPTQTHTTHFYGPLTLPRLPPRPFSFAPPQPGRESVGLLGLLFPPTVPSFNRFPFSKHRKMIIYKHSSPLHVKYGRHLFIVRSPLPSSERFYIPFSMPCPMCRTRATKPPIS